MAFKDLSFTAPKEKTELLAHRFKGYYRTKTD